MDCELFKIKGSLISYKSQINWPRTELLNVTGCRAPSLIDSRRRATDDQNQTLLRMNRTTTKRELPLLFVTVSHFSCTAKHGPLGHTLINIEGIQQDDDKMAQQTLSYIKQQRSKDTSDPSVFAATKG